MDKLKNFFKKNFRNSYFLVNKIYLFVIFIFISISDITLGILYFILSAAIYAKKLLTASVPMEINENIRTETHIYKNTKSRNLKIDIYFPNNNFTSNPTVYFCHGGGWISGFRDQPNNVSWCKFLASRGFLVTSIDYRYGYTNSMFDLSSDYFDGLQYIKDNARKFKIDPENIILMGLSAGGHLALLYSTFLSSNNHLDYLDGIRAVVAYYPPTNLKDIVDSDESKSFLVKFATSRTLKDAPSEFDDVHSYYSPSSWVSPRMIPCLIAHGKNDTIVPFSSSLEFTKLLEVNKIDYEFLVHKSANHSFDTELKDYKTVDILEKTVRFMNKHLELE